jgi:hypothetical protein
VAIVNGYITLAELKTYLGLSGSAQDDNLENAIEGASREIDAICGRFFFQTSSEIKYFTPISRTYLEIPDLSSTSGLEVKIDTTDDGTHDTTLTINTDFYLKPLDAGENEVEGVERQPFTHIYILDTRRDLTQILLSQLKLQDFGDSVENLTQSNKQHLYKVQDYLKGKMLHSHLMVDKIQEVFRFKVV